MSGPFDGSGSSAFRRISAARRCRRSSIRGVPPLAVRSKRPKPAGGTPSPRPASGGSRQGRWQPTGVISRWSNSKIAGVLAVAMVVTLGLGAVFGDVALNALIGGINHINPFCTSCTRPSGGAVGDLNVLIIGSDSRAPG